ncbi:hypothetical protein MMC18_004719 [Xylographa bjoerkii]|nr:hypothetical protein [Xylographa bjoerkii]
MKSLPLPTSSSIPAQFSLSVPRPRFSKVSSCLVRKSIHRWTTEEQVILCVLERWFESKKPVGKRLLSYQDMRDIFAAYFADTIKFCGEVQEISASAIGAQLWEIRNDGEHSAAWKEVFLKTDFLDPHGYWAATRSDLSATASDLGIELFQKPAENKLKILGGAGKRLNRDRKRRKIQDSMDLDSVTEYTGDSEEEDLIHRSSRTSRFELLTPKSGSKRSRTHQEQPITSVYQTWTSSQDKDNSFGGQWKSPMALPPTPIKSPLSERNIVGTWTKRVLAFENDVVFRFYDNNSQGTNTASGFRAGTFVDLDLESAPIAHPGLSSEAYLDPAENHLRRFHVATPFISIWESLLPALHRGLRSNAHSAGNAHIAIIDAGKLDIGHPSEYARAIRVRDVVYELKTRGRYLDMRYWGSSEYLVYAEIPRTAILTTFSIDALRTYLETHQGLETMTILRLPGIEAATRQIEYNAHLKETVLPMSLFAGKTIGHFLAFTGLPKANLELMALRISWVWMFTGAANQQRKFAYLEGVQEGYLSYHREPSLVEPQLPDERTAKEGKVVETTTADDFLIRRQRIQRILEQWASQETDGVYED